MCVCVHACVCVCIYLNIHKMESRHIQINTHTHTHTHPPMLLHMHVTFQFMQVYSRLNKLGLSVSYRQSLRLLEIFGKDFDKDVCDWSEALQTDITADTTVSFISQINHRHTRHIHILMYSIYIWLFWINPQCIATLCSSRAS